MRAALLQREVQHGRCRPPAPFAQRCDEAVLAPAHAVATGCPSRARSGKFRRSGSSLDAILSRVCAFERSITSGMIRSWALVEKNTFTLGQKGFLRLLHDHADAAGLHAHERPDRVNAKALHQRTEYRIVEMAFPPLGHLLQRHRRIPAVLIGTIRCDRIVYIADRVRIAQDRRGDLIDERGGLVGIHGTTHARLLEHVGDGHARCCADLDRALQFIPHRRSLGGGLDRRHAVKHIGDGVRDFLHDVGRRSAT